MKLRIFLLACTVVFLTSCGSSKKVVKNSPKSVVLEDEPINEVLPELPQLEPVVKRVKTNSNHTIAYIEKFAPIAVKKMHEHNIPASITLAQGVLESGSGRSPLAIRSNNHFGIKCHKGWNGKSVTHDDDEIGECFRKYKYPETSYEDHSKFLTSRKRYAKLFRLKSTDYRGWAYGLKKAGYATDKKYPNKLIGIIRMYNLDQYDRVPKNNKLVVDNSISTYSENNYQVQKGDTLYSIARKYNISVKLLKKTNGLNSNTISIGQQLRIN
ncbi:flagellum-specific peptidoglycan hydrolase FlgJ [Tenacibaculum adriaticum]|uniref:Peptidoglycan hydrolase n=1 Tax=Tenacibaculum adriaticum TaxID=413713 RepID=A0A5S5DPP9_9FLAO|nr:glucosaminidase domain-containing protein [Tenacibaculum adriaticum]TYP97871.1 flagellum-specific peptidoglycan hydrolase FlgJ [Tenacibaculum adriaticum]